VGWGGAVPAILVHGIAVSTIKTFCGVGRGVGGSGSVRCAASAWGELSQSEIRSTGTTEAKRMTPFVRLLFKCLNRKLVLVLDVKGANFSVKFCLFDGPLQAMTPSPQAENGSNQPQPNPPPERAALLAD